MWRTERLTTRPPYALGESVNATGRGGMAGAAAGRGDADKFLAGADLHVRHLRGQAIDIAVPANQPQLGRVPGFAAGEPPGGEFMPLALDRGAARGEILELAHRAEATAPFAGAAGILAQLVAGHP